MSRKLIVVLSAGLAIGALGISQSFAQADKPAAAAQASTDVSGPWHYQMEGRDGQKTNINLKLKQDGEKLTGTIGGGRGEPTEISDGTIKNGEFAFKVVRTWNGNEMVTKYSGKLEGDTLKGKSAMERNGQVREREFVATRGEAPATQPAQQ